MQTIANLLPGLGFLYAVQIFYRWVAYDAERAIAGPPDVWLD